MRFPLWKTSERRVCPKALGWKEKKTAERKDSLFSTPCQCKDLEIAVAINLTYTTADKQHRWLATSKTNFHLGRGEEAHECVQSEHWANSLPVWHRKYLASVNDPLHCAFYGRLSVFFTWINKYTARKCTLLYVYCRLLARSRAQPSHKQEICRSLPSQRSGVCFH